MIQRKHVVAFLVVYAVGIEMVTRSNLNIAIVSMVKVDDYLVVPSPGPKYDWSPSTQGLILGALNIGIVLTQIPAGRLAERFGGKWFCLAGIFISGLVNVLTPISAQYLALMVFSRVILGMAQGLIFPSCVDIIFSWLGRSHAAAMLGLLSVGAYIGTIFTTLVTGYLCDQTFLSGWPAAFFLSGMLTLFWIVLWIPLVGNHPKTPLGTFSENGESESEVNESTHLLSNQLKLKSGKNVKEKEANDRKSRYRSLPLKSMLKSGPVWACIIGKLASSWASSSVVSKLPAYFQEELGMSTSTVGLISGLIYIPLCLSVTFGAISSDLIIRKNLLSRTKTRKVFQAVAVAGSSLSILLIPWIGKNVHLLVTDLVLAKIFFGLMSGGESPLIAEMTTRFSSTLYALTNVASFLTGLLSPWVCGLILESPFIPSKSNQWSVIFYLAGVVNSIGGIAFCLLADANIQSWDLDQEDPCGEEGHHQDEGDQIDGHKDENEKQLIPAHHIIRNPLISSRSYLIDSFSLSKCVE